MMIFHTVHALYDEISFVKPYCIVRVAGRYMALDTSGEHYCTDITEGAPNPTLTKQLYSIGYEMLTEVSE